MLRQIMANKTVKYIKHLVQNLLWRIYHIWTSMLMKRIRKKDKIRFLFILQELSQWKTEMLYKAMLMHPRFEPIIGVVPCLGFPGAENKLIEYLKEKNYEFIYLDTETTLSSQIDIDMVLHPRPYPSEIYKAHSITRNLSIPIVSIPYFMNTITENWVVNQRVNILAWRQFLDNEDVRKEWEKIHRLHGINLAVTGLPIMDENLVPKNNLEDVWPVKDNRKRIIYAPHHTIGTIHVSGIAYSTFLEYCDFMLELKSKYKEQVYFIFKPHPYLFHNLCLVWGEEKAKEYYNKWQEPGYSHIEVNTKYIALFKHSDAMIHDCGSFTIEYMYSGNPVMYLIRGEDHESNMNSCGKKAYQLHYKGRTQSDIESFVNDVIEGRDELKPARETFIKESLLPPNGKSACENIIQAILGEGSYK